MDLQLKSLEGLLVERGRVSSEDLRKVRRLQQERGERIERLLLDLGFISEDDLLPVFSEHLGVPLVGRKELPTAPVAIPTTSAHNKPAHAAARAVLIFALDYSSLARRPVLSPCVSL